MNTDFFPNFLQPFILQIQKDISQAEKVQGIGHLFEKIIGWLGKLAILEYIQTSKKTKKFYSNIFSFTMPQSAGNWIHIIQKLLQNTPDNFSSCVLAPLLKYPSFKQKNTQDRVARLCSFYEMAACSNYLISSNDFLEANEQIWDFLVDLEFLHNVRYQYKEKNSVMLLENKAIFLEPFFALIEKEGKLSLEEKDGATLEKLYEHYLPGEWKEYKKEEQGSIDFEEFIDRNKNYIFIPWLENRIQQTIQNTLDWEKKMPFGNIFFVEGYPGAGKTALATHLKDFFHNGTIEHCSGYFLEKSIALKANSIIAFFKTQLEKIHVPEYKILFFIDGLEGLTKTEYHKLLEKIKEHPFHNILFFFFIRCNTYPIDHVRKFFLPCEDNPFFEECFTKDYIQSLTEKYLCSSLGRKIFHFLKENPYSFFTGNEIAKFFGIFTPVVLKELQFMKPLLSCMTLPQGQESYRIFHPICKIF